ncbi:hypothetical protein KFE25_006496 [Diacronema lutheri]|uniref:DUF493 domain-containing protein n=2 Tax=Diacronema lutheri TaxID=2081491 RepID=A0A8J5XVZ7_DIALT|nr:hypothetical protein KFE25_006496 [Diacronema lutheri]
MALFVLASAMTLARAVHTPWQHRSPHVAGAARMLRRSAWACRASASDAKDDGVNSDNVASNVAGFTSGGPIFSNPLPRPTGMRVDEIVDFPTRLRFKIIGVADDTFVADIEQICSLSSGHQVTATSLRDNGKYKSITIDLRIDSAQVFYRVYEDVGKDSRVKFMI